MSEHHYIIEPIGMICSRLTAIESAPLQGDEGAPEAWLELRASVAEGLLGISVGDEIIVLTWLHCTQRNVLQVHPRSDLKASLTGVFATRSPDRPNPIGLHRVSVWEIVGHRLRVGPMEAIDGTPVIDLKPSLRPVKERARPT